MRFFCLTFCLVLAAAMALAQPAQPPHSPLLCGDNQVQWLIRPGADGNSFDVLFRPAGEKWQTLAIGLTGKPALVASPGGTLHVIFKDPLGQGMFQVSSPAMLPLEKPSDPQWPPGTVPLALCSADKFGAATQPSLIALVPRYPNPPSTAPTSSTSAPASRLSTTSASPELVFLQPFQFAEGKWQPAPAKLPEPLAFTSLAKDGRVLTAVAGGRLYRIISTPDHDACEFAVWDNSTNKDLPAWRPIPLGTDLAGSKPIAMLTLAGKLAIVAAGPGDKQKIQLTLRVMEDPGHFSKCTIRLGQKPYAWDSSSEPVAAGCGEQFELVWPRDGKLMDSRCALNGQMKEPEEVPADTHEADAKAKQAYEYFLLGVFVIIVALLALRRQMLPKPFELSPRMIPGNLLKRGLAAFLDMLPWFGVAALVFRVNSEDFKAPFGDPLPSNNLIYWQILWQSLYVVYCTLMETFLGATVGKLILRLRVVDDKGQRPNLRSVALRNLMKVIELLPLVSQLPLLLLLPIISPYRLRIGDIMAHTFVIESRLLPPPQEQNDRDSHNSRA